VTVGESLAEALPREMARVRDVVMPAYAAIGPVGAPGLAMMRHSLDRAAQVAAAGDVVGMIAALQDLRGYKE
jgi:hypothetical protein